MKNFRNILFLTALSFFTLSMISCGNSNSGSDQTEQQGDEYTSTYICPMHCEGSGSDEPGTCPVCGMDYVLNEKHMENEHTH